MDVLKFLQEGNKTPNPLYNPKTKKGAVQPPVLVNNNPGDSFSDKLTSGLYRNVAAQSYNLNQYIDDNHHEYGIYVNPVDSREDLDRERAENQSRMEQTWNFAVQAVGNEIALGIVKGFSDTADALINLGKKEGENDYTNPLSLALEEAQEKIRNEFAIYRENPNEDWDVGDFAWWASNAVSVASSAAMLIPSIGAVKAVGLIGKGLNAIRGFSKVARGLTKAVAKGASRATGRTIAANTISNALGRARDISVGALTSRTAEGYIEAREVWKASYEDAKSKLAEMTDEERALMLEANPNMVDMNDEERARYIAGKSADKTFAEDYWLLALDMLQFKAISNLWKGTRNATTNAAMRIANRNAARQLAGVADDALERTSFLARRKDAFKHMLKHPLTSAGVIEWSEGLEEGFQGINTEKGKEVGKRILDPTFTGRTLESYLTDPAIYEQAFWGILGGMGFKAASNGLGRLGRAVKGKIDKHRLSDVEYALSQLSEEKIRMSEIEGRNEIVERYAEDMQMINSGRDPYQIKLDADGKPILENGNYVNVDISEDQIDELKAQRTADFITEITLDATDRGNYELLREYMSSKEFNDYFERAGIQGSSDKTLTQRLLEQTDKVYNEYSNALSDVLTTAEVENQHVARLVARNIARRKLETNQLEERITDLQSYINENTDNAEYSDLYERKQRAEYIGKQLDELQKRTIKLNFDLNTNAISQEAYDSYKKDYDNRRRQLMRDLNTIDHEFVYDEQNTIIGNMANFDEYVDKINKLFIDKAATTATAITPKKEIADRINNKIRLEDRRNFVNRTLPTTQEAYQAEYDEFAITNDNLVRKRYDDAVDRVSSWIERQDDLDAAFEDIITKRAPQELHEDITILKLGHHSTKQFADALAATIKQIKKDRESGNGIRQDGNPVTGNNANNLRQEIENNRPAGNQQNNNQANNPPNTQGSSMGSQQQTTPAGTAGTVNQGQQQASPQTQANVPQQDTSQPQQAPSQNPAQAVNLGEDPNTPGPDSATESYIRNQENDFVIDADYRANGLAIGAARDLFHTSRNLFDNLEGKSVNDAEFDTIIDAIEENLIEQGVSAGVARQAAKTGLKIALESISRQVRNKNATAADTFKRLAIELSSGMRVESPDGTVMNAVTKPIEDVEIDSVIDDFLKAYINLRGINTNKKGRTIINLENVINAILSDKDISYDEAERIIINLHKFVNNKANDKYIFTKKAELNSNIRNLRGFFNELEEAKTRVNPINNYMHIAAPSKDNPKRLDALLSALQGEDIELEYFTAERGYSKNSISVKCNGVEIGYIGTVVADGTNSTFALKKQNQGFNYTITKDADGNITTNVNEFFINIITKAAGFEELSDLAFKQFLWEKAVKQDSPSSIELALTRDDWKTVLNHPAIKKLIDEQLLLIPKWASTDEEKAKYILNRINNIVFYDGNEEYIQDSILKSYEQWKENMFRNYTDTHTIQQHLDAKKKIRTKLVSISQRKVITSDKDHDVKDLDFHYDQHPIVVVEDNGTPDGIIVCESNNTVYDNKVKFKPGTMGILIGDNPNAPIIARFTAVNKVVDANKNLANAIYTEVSNLLKGYQNGTVSFKDLSTALGDLFSGPSTNSSRLFTGYSVVTTKDAILLNLHGKKDKVVLAIYNKDQSNNEVRNITHNPNGDRSQSMTTNAVDNNFINTIAKELVSNLHFNATFYAVTHKNAREEHSNKYFYKSKGKLVINIGGYKQEYHNFSEFVLKNNAFKTNQWEDNRGNYFTYENFDNSMFINVKTIDNPVEGRAEVKTMNEVLTDIPKEGVTTTEVLEAARVSKEDARILTEEIVPGVRLIPESIYHDKNTNVAFALYKKGKVYITNKGITRLRNRPDEVVRLLLHENLHAQFDKHNLFERNKIVDDLMNTYEAFVQAVENDLATQPQDSIRYKLAKSIKQSLLDDNFTPANYVNKLDAKEKVKWDKLSDAEKARRFAEEWLVESLSQKNLIKYLNMVNYGDASIDIENIAKPKTIFQKIIDAILKLFGYKTTDINKSSILAQQYSLLGDNSTTENASEIITETHKPHDTNDTTVGDNTSTNINEAPTITETPTERNDIIEEENINTEISLVESEDDADFALTNPIEDVEIENHKYAIDVNTNGVRTINDMNEFINSFPLQDRPLVARMVAQNQIKFVCQ